MKRRGREKENIVPLMTTALLPYGKSDEAPLPLSFTESYRKLTQKRYAGRVALVPVIDLAEFMFKAVIDWVTIRVNLKRVTQFRFLQEYLSSFLGESAYVDPVRPGAGGESSIFDVTIQEPRSLADIMEISAYIGDMFGEASEPEIRAIEFSVDAYPHVPEQQKRDLLIGVMQRSIFTTRDIWKNPGSRPRSSIGPKSPHKADMKNRKLLVEGRKGIPGEAYLCPDSHRAPFLDGTMYLGDRDKDDVMMRIMDKMLDKQNFADGTRKVLSETEKRVRIEVRIRGKELASLGLTTIADFRGFSFNKLQRRYFQFKLATFKKAPANVTPRETLIISEAERRRSEILLRSGVLGLHARDQAQTEYRKVHLPMLRRLFQNQGRLFKDQGRNMGPTGSFVSYEALNMKMSTAFRHLDESEKRSWRRFARCKGTLEV